MYNIFDEWSLLNEFAYPMKPQKRVKGGKVILAMISGEVISTRMLWEFPLPVLIKMDGLYGSPV